MKRTVLLTAVMLTLASLCSSIHGTSQMNTPSDPAQIPTANLSQPGMKIEPIDMTPMSFTENVGQWDDRVRFRASAGGATMWFTTEGVCYQFTRRMPDSRGQQTLLESQDLASSSAVGHPDTPHYGLGHKPDSVEQLVIRASVVGANPNPVIVGADVMDYKCNYFIGNDPDKWHTDVPNYSAVVFKDIYVGIDLRYYGNGEQMEYDFIVSPGADPDQIMVQYEGAESINVNENGELVVETDWGIVTELRPHVYQLDAFGPILIEGEYTLFPGNRFGFTLNDRYDPTLALVIDPVLTYSTFLGGGGSDYGYGIAVDGSGAAYVTGYTYSSNFPTVDPYQTDQGTWDVFVTKLTASGSDLQYSTYLGGDDIEEGKAIAVDASGSAYVVGYTVSSDFPAVSAYQDTLCGKQDVFVAKLNPDGNGLIYSTYIGDSERDEGHGIALDASGSAYVTGLTESEDYPTVNQYQSDPDDNNRDAFVTKLSASGSSLVYSTYLAGSGYESGFGIAVDGSGAAYVTGLTISTDFPTVNQYQTYQGFQDAFVSKLASSGSNLDYSTYLGGGEMDAGSGIAVTTSGEAYVTGSTYSLDFPTQNPYQTDPEDWEDDVFITKLSSSGNSLIYSTYLGGDGDDLGLCIAVDGSGSAYVAGVTYSSNLPVEDPYQATYQGGETDGFVAKLSASGSGLDYSTYLGGSDDEECYGIAVDGSGAAYVVGYTSSTDFPTLNQYQTDQGFQDPFVTKLSVSGGYICGDANASGDVDIDDIMYLIAYVFTGGPEPDPYDSGDVNCSGFVDIDDIMYLIDYMFTGGPDPCDVDIDGEPDC